MSKKIFDLGAGAMIVGGVDMTKHVAKLTAEAPSLAGIPVVSSPFLPSDTVLVVDPKALPDLNLKIDLAVDKSKFDQAVKNLGLEMGKATEAMLKFGTAAAGLKMGTDDYDYKYAFSTSTAEKPSPQTNSGVGVGAHNFAASFMTTGGGYGLESTADGGIRDVEPQKSKAKFVPDELPNVKRGIALGGVPKDEEPEPPILTKPQPALWKPDAATVVPPSPPVLEKPTVGGVHLGDLVSEEQRMTAAGVTTRRIYRTLAGGNALKLIATIQSEGGAEHVVDESVSPVEFSHSGFEPSGGEPVEASESLVEKIKNYWKNY